MSEKKEKFPSTFTVDNYNNFSSTATLAHNEIKVPVGSVDSINEKEYNPYDHRQLEHPNTFFGALVHLLKSSLGTGILAIPKAFYNSGLIVGLIGTILIGILCTHTIHILVAASQKMCKAMKVPSLGFAETAEAVVKHGPQKLRRFSRAAKYFVEIALVLTYYIGNSVYVVFITNSINQLVSNYYPETKDWDQYYKLMLLLPLILCCQIRELKYLVPFSLIANTTMITAFGITLYYMFSGIGDIDINNISMAKGIGGIPLFFSTVIFAMEGIGTIMPVENSMVSPKFIGCPSVLNVAMAAVVTLYTTIGFFGYLRYGEGVEDAITQNLPKGDIAAQIGQACISTAVFFTFMLQFYVPIDITWREINHLIPEKHHNISQILLRTGLVCFIVGIAAAAGDNLGLLIDLVGAIFFSTLGLVVPAVVDILLRMDNEHGVLKWRLWKNIVIIILALFGLFSGSYFAIKAMIDKT